MQTKIRELANFSICNKFNSDYIYSVLTQLKLSDDSAKIILQLLYTMSYCAYTQGLINEYSVVEEECRDKEFTDHINLLINDAIDRICDSNDEEAVNEFLYVYYQYKNAIEAVENQPLQ